MSAGSARLHAVFALTFALAFVGATRVQASPPLHGAVDGRALFAPGRVGGALGIDLWWGEGVARLGGTFGVGALSAHAGLSSRVFSPLGLSLSLGPAGDRSGVTGTLRAGAYAGAEKGGLLLGPWGSAALGFRLSLGEGASLRLGADTWILLGKHSVWGVGPYAGFGF